MAQFAMSTVGQGSTSYIALPTWNATGATEATGGYYIRIKFKVESLAAVNHLVGSSGATSGSLRTTTAGALLYRNNTADLITSSEGAIVAGQVHEAILRRLYTPSAAIQLELDGSIVNTTSTTTLGWLTSVSQLARFSTSARSDITVYEFEVFNGASSYSAVWDDTGATGSGTTWADDTATRNLTITNATGAADSWWAFYGASAISSTLTWSISPLQWQGSAAATPPTFSSVAAWSVSPMVWQASAAVSPPTFTSSAAWSVGPLQWQGAAAATVPTFTSTAAWSISPLVWQGAVNASAPGAITSSVAWAIGPMQWQGAASAAVPTFTSAAAWSVGPLQWQGVANASAPGAVTSAAAWSVGPLQWQGAAAATVPTFSSAASWQISPLVWQVSASVGGEPVFVAKGATITERLQTNAIIERLQTARITE